MRVFHALFSVHTPFRWQCRLFDELAAGRIPLTVTLPTGLGKTSIIPIWLIALAHSADNGLRLPRRLVYIVNRRTVVDQATEDAARILSTLSVLDSDNGPLAQLRKALARLAGGDLQVPLAVSTLRGELADNGEWKKNPARPVIIVGTIDMIGSKLLFSGYGDGRYGRAHHAGLIGQDTLIVHDEAHLSPAFSRLLWKIEREQREANEPRPVRVLELTATSRDDAREDREAVRRLRGAEASADFTLIKEDDADAIVTQRRTASKTLTLQTYDAGKGNLAQAIATKALTYRDSKERILIYVRLPEDAKAIADAIKNPKTGLGKDGDGRVRLLTGTIRGFERDQLANSELFRAFRSDPARPPKLEQALYLVSTSAGEIGADLDADHLVCDLSTLDSMAQRIGRMNRLGGGSRSAKISVVVAPIGDKDPVRPQLEMTGEALRELPAKNDGFDVSPEALSNLLNTDDAKLAFSPPPTILPATDILFDAWALTSITGELPGRPGVEPYLHGVAEWEPPETHVAWRADIGELGRAGVAEDDLAEMLEVFPIRAAERLRDRRDRVQEQLARIAARQNDVKVVLIRNGEPRWVTLAELAPADKTDKAKLNEARRLLSYATVLLPTEVGGLKAGMLDGNEEAPKQHQDLDVAEAALADQLARQRLRVTDDEVKPLLGEQVNTTLVERCRLALAASDSANEDISPATIEYRVAKAESGEPGTRVRLADHSGTVVTTAKRIGAALGLEQPVYEALALAAHWHDSGKNRPIWQRYARKGDSSAPLAKSDRYLHWKALNFYRHEFGSLLDATFGDADGNPVSEVASHAERDLILHLIAAHHGWSRPHFEPMAFDRERPTKDNEAALVEAMQRFARLQRRFGRWGLAWLESLLRCADALASADQNGGGA
ncbi:MAG: type I-U CRISPR-associated helicase/endonuclease Cas3 [Phycisphaerales bacterium]|nr:type I-U CRISPR-associated helicase/endonuclease Cas3 [Phycisphaerales bacterium]